MERLVKQLYAQRGIDAPPFERPNAWVDDGPFTLDAYIEGIREGWPEPDIERWIVCGLPRDFNILGVAEQRKALVVSSPQKRLHGAMETIHKRAKTTTGLPAAVAQSGTGRRTPAERPPRVDTSGSFCQHAAHGQRG